MRIWNPWWFRKCTVFETSDLLSLQPRTTLVASTQGIQMIINLYLGRYMYSTVICMKPALLTSSSSICITWVYGNHRAVMSWKVSLEYKQIERWGNAAESKFDCSWDGTEAAAQCLRVTPTGWVHHEKYTEIRQWAESDHYNCRSTNLEVMVLLMAS